MAGADPCCDDIIGGEIYLTVKYNEGGFETFEGMGDVRIQPTRLIRTAGASTGGRMWVTEASQPIRAIMNYANRCNHNPMRLFQARCKIDATIVEKSRGFWHLLTDCIVVGAPEINLSTGVISGMELAADTYDVSVGTGRMQPDIVPMPEYYQAA